MYCKKCGVVIPDDAAFCPTCGTTQSNEGASAQSNEVAPAQKKKKQGIAFWIGCVICVIGWLTMAGGELSVAENNVLMLITLTCASACFFYANKKNKK